MSLVFRVSLYALALSLSLKSPVFSQVQSSSAALNSSQSPAETAVHMLVEKYYAFYAAKDLDGLMGLWNRQSPNYPSRRALEKQFEAKDATVGRPAISRLKIEDKRASLRLLMEMTQPGKQNKSPLREVRSLTLICDADGWKLWEDASFFEELAAALAKTAIEEERAKLLAEENESECEELLNALNRLGAQKRTEGDYAQALALAQIALQIAERLGDPNGKAEALYNQGNVHLNQGNFEQSLTRLQESLRLFEASDRKDRVAAILNDIAFVNRMQGRNEDALDAFHRSKKLFEELGRRENVAVVSGNLSDLYIGEGRYDQARQYLREALTVFEEAHAKPGIGTTLSRIGLIDYYQGRYVEALEKFRQSLRVREELGSRQGIALIHNRIGMVYDNLGLSKLALESYQKSLRLFEEVGDRFNLATALLNIGSNYNDQGDDEQAVMYFQQSLKTFEELGTKGEAAKPLHNIGKIYLKQGRHELALETFEKCLRIQEALNDKLGVTITLKNIGLAQRAQGRYAEALETSHKALALAQEMNNPEQLWRIHESLGRTLLALGQPDQSRQHFLEAIATIESLRQQVGEGEQQQQSFFENKLSPWLGMIDLLVSQHRPAEALTFAERSKARVLLDVLQAGRANLSKSLSPQERQNEEDQRLRLVALNSQLTGELRRKQPDRARAAELRARIEKARLEFEALETSLYLAHPELKVHRGETSIIKAEELATLLPNAASALLEYVVTEEVTYLFTVTKAQNRPAAEVQVFTLPIKKAELVKQVERFRGQLAGRDLGYRALAHKLYNLLLKPAETLLRGKASLVIAPDDELWELPYQALLTADNHHVIETSAVSYTPSMTALREMRAYRDRRPTDASAPALLAFGNPAIGKETVQRAALRDEKLDPLPEAEQEVRALGQLYSAANSKVYVGVEAREDRVKAEAGRARILHFATHGTLNNASPMYSHLVLAQGDTNEDGLLEAWELMQMDLNADLAVLSACETARGRYSAGEGMIGLTWALFVARVPSTVVSQWKVESASTRDLMLSFHRRMRAPSEAAKATMKKAEALRQASLKLMKTPETSHPFFWAGFVLVGDGR